jgi:hypothetical protein
MAKLPAVLLAACAALLALAAPLLAGDPDMLQDLCVADYKSLEGRKCDDLPCIDAYSSSNADMYICIMHELRMIPCSTPSERVQEAGEPKMPI